VEYVTVERRLVTLTNQLPGRTSPYETSEVRPQVNGLVEARLFKEGDLVHKGQPLYRIDASPYEAQVANAQAALAKARAAVTSSVGLARIPSLLVFSLLLPGHLLIGDRRVLGTARPLPSGS
jgi:membrane fusion protein, multidrug efflux system